MKYLNSLIIAKGSKYELLSLIIGYFNSSKVDLPIDYTHNWGFSSRLLLIIILTSFQS